MKNKKVITMVAATSLSILMSVPTFATGWTKGISKPLWWYDLGNGQYHKSSWQWLDGNNDGIAECYLFDADGWMYENTMTPDGYYVNKDGAWTVNGVAQTKKVSVGPVLGGSVSSSSRRVHSSGGGGSSRRSSSGSSSRRTNNSVINNSVVNTNNNLATKSDAINKIENNNNNNANINTNTNINTDVNNSHVENDDKYGSEVNKMIGLINLQRMAAGLNELEVDETLMEIANIRVKESVEYFEHFRPFNHELSFRSIFSEYGYSTPTSYAGEILYASGGKIDAKRGIDWWMNSEGHRWDILNKEHTHIGAAITENNKEKDYDYNYIVVFYNMKDGENIIKKVEENPEILKTFHSMFYYLVNSEKFVEYINENPRLLEYIKENKNIKREIEDSLDEKPYSNHDVTYRELLNKIHYFD